MTARPPESSEPGPTAGGYPYGWDCVWLAVDEIRQVAAFATAGIAPVPVAVFDPPEVLDTAEKLVWDLPVRGEFVRHFQPPADPAPLGWFSWFARPPELPKGPGTSCYEEFARRGVFGYDWFDAHRFRLGEKTGTYDLIAAPTSPARVDDLDPAVGELARLVRFEGIRFGQYTSVAVAQRVPCLWGGSTGSPGYPA